MTRLLLALTVAFCALTAHGQGVPPPFSKSPVYDAANVSVSGGSITGASVSATTLQASGAVTLSPASANVVLSPTGTGVVTINPATAGAIDNVAIGATTRGAVNATTLNSNSTTTLRSSTIPANLLVSSTAPTISSGFGGSPSVSSNNGTAAFRVNVGTGGVATSGVIGLPAATTGWNCQCNDITTASATVFLCKQTASATNTATVGNFNTAGAAAAWVASDILAVSCFAY